MEKESGRQQQQSGSVARPGCCSLQGGDWAERPWARLCCALCSALGVCGRVGVRGEPVDSGCQRQGGGVGQVCDRGSTRTAEQQQPAVSLFHPRSLSLTLHRSRLERAGRGDWTLDRRVARVSGTMYRTAWAPRQRVGDDSERDLPDASECARRTTAPRNSQALPRSHAPAITPPPSAGCGVNFGRQQPWTAWAQRILQSRQAVSV